MKRDSEPYTTATEFAETRAEEACDLPCCNPMPMHHSVPGDDRYPGTFFRVPGRPVPGKTAWSLIQ
jgi:hypothetical protein